MSARQIFIIYIPKVTRAPIGGDHRNNRVSRSGWLGMDNCVVGVIIAAGVGSTVHYDSDERERCMCHSAEEDEELSGSKAAAVGA